MLIGGISLLFIAVVMMAISVLSSSVESRFIAGAEWLAHSTADQIAGYFTNDQTPGSLRQELKELVNRRVAEYLLYAQVVKQGTILAEDRAPTASRLDLRVVEFPPSQGDFVRARNKLPHGPSYLDLMIRLKVETETSSASYLRLGVSMAPSQAAVRKGELIIALTGLGGLIVSILLILYWSKRIVPGPSVKPTSQLTTAQKSPGNLIHAGDLLIDDKAKEVRLGDQAVELSPKEYRLLKLLASEPGKVFSKEEILERIWHTQGNYRASADDVRTYVRFLRQKLEDDPQNPHWIKTVAGFGYKFQT